MLRCGGRGGGGLTALVPNADMHHHHAHRVYVVAKAAHIMMMCDVYVSACACVCIGDSLSANAAPSLTAYRSLAGFVYIEFRLDSARRLPARCD